MKPRHLVIAWLLMWPWVTQANPVNVDGQSLLAFGIVAFWALVVESGIATLSLLGSGVVMVPMFVTLVFTNLGIFLFAFFPLTDDIALWLLEVGVVLADALVIKLLTSAKFQEGASVSWLRALVASLCGNAASYFLGTIASAEPWYTHI